MTGGNTRRLWVRTAIAFALVLSAVPAGAAETLRLGKSAPNVFSYALINVGVKQGLFRKYGIEIEDTDFAGGPRLQQALAAGSVDIGLDAGPDMALIVKGAPVKAVAALSGAPYELGVMVRADSSIKSVADLKGKKVSASGAGTLTGWLTRELSRSQGWGPDGIVLITTTSPSTGMAMLRTGQTDGMTASISVELDAQEKGISRVIYNFGDLVHDFHNQVIFATDKLIAEKPDALRNFLRGWIDTVAFVQGNKAATVSIISEALGMNQALVGSVYDILAKNYSADGHFNPKALKTLSRSFVELKLLDKEPDMSSLYTEAFLPK